jgi:hypothetical protein
MVVPPSPKGPNPLPVAVTNSTTTNNTLPVLLQNNNDFTVNNNVIVSQPNRNNTISISSVENLPANTSTTSFNHDTTLSTNSSTKQLVLVHHKEDVNYVLSDLCLTASEKNDSDLNICKYGSANCMVLKSQVEKSGTLCHELSNSVFMPTPNILKQYKYPIIDTTLLKCAVPSCKALGTKKRRVFHYACWRHAMSLKVNSDLKVIHLQGKDDRILRYYDCNDEDRDMITSQLTHDTKLIFPVCGKCCLNKVNALRNLDEEKLLKEQTTGILNWDKDGSDVEKSSIEVLIDWLTTEENASKYFGGVDKDGRTNSERRESYHILIRDLIKKENGKFKNILYVALL